MSTRSCFSAVWARRCWLRCLAQWIWQSWGRFWSYPLSLGADAAAERGVAPVRRGSSADAACRRGRRPADTSRWQSRAPPCSGTTSLPVFLGSLPTLSPCSGSGSGSDSRSCCGWGCGSGCGCWRLVARPATAALLTTGDSSVMVVLKCIPPSDYLRAL